MLWEELTAPNFEKAVKDCGGVCVLPIGVLEKHGNHLPLGTDMYQVTSVCKAAAEAEPAIVFPYYFMGQIAEARHYPGTISTSYKLMLDVLLAMCDEISRNGLKKIIIMSGHGGNGHFLPFFAQSMLGLDRDYAVYTGFASTFSDEQREIITQKAGTPHFGSHAGLTETAKMMYLRGDLVRMEDQKDLSQCKSLGRLDDIQDVKLFSGFNWYANYPYHFAGDPSPATAEIGKLLFDMAVENTASAIKAVKADNTSVKLIKEFTEYGKNPKADIRH